MTRARSESQVGGDRVRVPYRKVELAMWHDDVFASLSSPQPCGKWLWVYLLTGPRTTPLPGLVVAREAVMADDLGWPLEAFRKAFQEAFAKGLVEGDPEAGVVVLRKALLTGSGRPRESARPASPNVLKGWAKHLAFVPECPLKFSYLRTLKAFAEALPEGFAKAFQEAFGEAFAKGVRYQDQGSGTENRRDPAEAPNERESLSILASPDADPEPSRTLTIAPEPEQQRAAPNGAPYVDLDLARRQRLRVAMFARLNRIRLGIAGEFAIANVRPLHPHDPGERDLADRIVESGADAEANCDHVLSCAELGARGGRTVKWLTGSLFGERQWRRFLGTTPAEAFADADREWRREHPDAPEAQTSEPRIVSTLGADEWDPFETPEAKAAIAKKRADALKGTKP